MITNHNGLPEDLVRKLGLRVSELLETKKEMVLTLKEGELLAQQPWIDSVQRKIARQKTPNESLFPNKLPFDWNEDNFGPIYIPKKGATIQLTKDNLPIYKKVIQEYEKNTLETTLDAILINGQKTDSYTFKQDYYWMMGDNRHRSEDSRYWGFVPEDHIVGKPIFIWFSIDGINDGIKNWRIRWDRVFTTVGGAGERTSYFPHFAIFVVLWQTFVIIRRKRKAKAVKK